jgi:uncharacterized protein
MSVFVDTSALLAVLDADDELHSQARRIWKDLLERAEDLVSTSYVLVETFALIQHRLGMEAVRTLEEDILPVIRIHWVNDIDHQAGVTALLAANRRQLSLVDCVSFLTMRRLNLKVAFAFDRHFTEQGFEVLA